MMSDSPNDGYGCAWAAASECGATARQLPFVLFASWWNATGVADLLGHQGRHAGPAADHALRIPAPTEDEGEHACSPEPHGIESPRARKEYSK